MQRRFSIDRQLYSGHFSVVHRGRDAADGAQVVLKRCRDSASARREIGVLTRLADAGCRNVLEPRERRLIGDDEIDAPEPKHEFYKQGYDHPATIVSGVYGPSPPACRTDEEVSGVLFDVLTALFDVHELGYIHCDVKRLNVLRDGPRYRLIDFGIAVRCDEPGAPLARGTPLVRGTPFNMAPEVILDTSRTPMIDMYSLGVMAYSLLHGGEHPIPAMNRVQDRKETHAVIAGAAYDPKRWTNELAPLARDLCRGLLQKYPMARFSAKEALSHPLFDPR